MMKPMFALRKSRGLKVAVSHKLLDEPLMNLLQDMARLVDAPCLCDKHHEHLSHLTDQMWKTFALHLVYGVIV